MDYINYDIQKKTPSGQWHIIHRSWAHDHVIEFMKMMEGGGYDGSGSEGTYDLTALTSQHYSRKNGEGDLIQYRAIPVILY